MAIIETMKKKKQISVINTELRRQLTNKDRFRLMSVHDAKHLQNQTSVLVKFIFGVDHLGIC